jgi:hypothetical protein
MGCGGITTGEEAVEINVAGSAAVQNGRVKGEKWEETKGENKTGKQK